MAEKTDPTSSGSRVARDPYGGVLLVLLGATLLGAVGVLAEGLALGNRVLLDAAVTLGVATGVLGCVAIARNRGTLSTRQRADAPGRARDSARPTGRRATLGLAATADWISRWVQSRGAMSTASFSISVAGALASSLVLLITVRAASPDAWSAAVAAALCLVAAGLAATAASYLAKIEPVRFREAPMLCRGARVVAWVLVIGVGSVVLTWATQHTIVLLAHVAVVVVNLVVCYELTSVRRPGSDALDGLFPHDLRVLSVLGSRPNLLASILDFAEHQLGIDLRSTWALTVVRRSLEPLVIGLCLAGWLSTSLTVVGIAEQGLVERFGVPLDGTPLAPGLHLHWPWPVDRVFRIPVLRVQTVTVGHQGEPRTGPEDVLWTVEHVTNEYTLLLGNGRDLITVDAAVQFRIADVRNWHYRSQNPAAALQAIAYRAVMRSTVNRTLSEALSENVVKVTERMRAMVQQDAEALGLGVEIVGFTVGGMHPPVRVADAYEAVVSAELGKVTAVVNAQAFRNHAVPSAEASAVAGEYTARADGAKALARAAGEAWAFRTLESQFRAAPQEYLFRRRLEAIETGLAGRRFGVVDSRFQRDGGVLWLTP